MDSPYLSSSSSSAFRSRVDSTFSVHSKDSGAIHKRHSLRPNRTRSISAAALERHPESLPDRVQEQLRLDPSSITIDSWNHPKHSPRPEPLQPPFRSPVPSSQPSVESVTTASRLSSQPVQNADPRSSSGSDSTRTSPPPTTSAEMASLGYLPAPHYTNMGFADPSYDSNYNQIEPHSNFPSTNNFNFLFGNSAPPPQQPVYTSGPLHMEPAFTAAPMEPTINTLNRATSPFHHSNYDSLDFSLPQSQNQASVSKSMSHSPMSQHLGPLTPPLTSGLDVPARLAGSPPLQPGVEAIRSPSMYETHAYSTSYPAQGPHYQALPSYSYPPARSASARQQVRKPSSEAHVRVINQKPKPQCWEHGCNGREFSTFSNLLRHQREKSGTAAKSYCPKCGAEFTRTTARNGHLAHEKCSKQRRSSEIK